MDNHLFSVTRSPAHRGNFCDASAPDVSIETAFLAKVRESLLSAAGLCTHARLEWAKITLTEPLAVDTFAINTPHLFAGTAG